MVLFIWSPCFGFLVQYYNVTGGIKLQFSVAFLFEYALQTSNIKLKTCIYSPHAHFFSYHGQSFDENRQLKPPPKKKPEKSAP
jgi:hypothetical protein